MWLGSHQQLKNVDVTDIPILSMQVKVSESARDLGVVLDSQASQLSLSSHVAALCRAGFFHLRQLRPAIQSMTTAAMQNSSPGFHLLPCRLLQTTFFGRSSRSRTPPHVWSPGLIYAITSRRCCVNCTGFLFVDESILQGCMSGAPVASGSDTRIPG